MALAKKFVFIWYFFVFHDLKAQLLFLDNQFIVVINYNDCTLKASVIKNEMKLKTKNEKTYTCYKAQKIFETKVGYSGKLLDGNYATYYLNDQLKEKGVTKNLLNKLHYFKKL